MSRTPPPALPLEIVHQYDTNGPQPGISPATTHFRASEDPYGGLHSEENDPRLASTSNLNASHHFAAGHASNQPQQHNAYPSSTPPNISKPSFHSILPLHNSSHNTPQVKDYTQVHDRSPNTSSQGGGPTVHNQKTPPFSRNHSFDVLGNVVGGKEFEEYDIRTGNGVDTLKFAEGDAGTTKFSKLYYFLISRSIITRWILFIVPVLALLWIPGIVWIVGDSNFRAKAKVWDVSLLWWSIWLSVFWGSWWGSMAFFKLLPAFIRATVGAVIGGDKTWVGHAKALEKYFCFFTWSLVTWIAFQPLIEARKDSAASTTTTSNLATMSNIFFGLFLSSCVLGGEKVAIQFIAYNFHKESYQDRIRTQNFQLKVLTILYQNSSDMGRSDTIIAKDGASTMTKGNMAKQGIKKVMRGMRNAAATTTNAIGNVASEMVGASVLQPNSPQSMVLAALSSPNKTRMLARRIYYSFRYGKDHIGLADIARFFPTLEIAQDGFAVLDVDENGDASRDEIEMALMEIHRDRLSLASSLRDLDGAIKNFDSILLWIVLLIDVLIMTSMITTKLTTLATSASTFLLSLSWLIGSTSQEILASCIFLLVKHPFDVGDNVTIDSIGYVVLEMNLLSTSFRRLDGKWCFIPNNILNTKLIENARRSGPTSESFAFEVAFDTSFDKIQALREKMLLFVKSEPRDYLPTWDVTIDDFAAQGKLQLKTDIRYKTNWQQGALKLQRRNKWVCALKTALAELKIFGPGGAGDPAPAPAEPTQYMEVPYVQRSPPPPPSSRASDDNITAVDVPAYSFVDRSNIIADPSQNLFGEDEAGGTLPPTRAGTPSPGQALRQRQNAAGGPPRRIQLRDGDGGEVIEMNEKTSGAV